MNKKVMGVFTITFSLFVWMLDKVTQDVSTRLGKVICGEHYTHVVNGMTGDSSCRFNIEMHLAYSLFTVLVLGIVLYMSSRKEMG